MDLYFCVWFCSLCVEGQSSGAPPSAFQVPYDSFRKQHDSTETNDSHDINSSVDVVGDVKSKELEYDFYCFFLSSQRLELYKSIDYRCEDMLLGNRIFMHPQWVLFCFLCFRLAYYLNWYVIKKLKAAKSGGICFSRQYGSHTSSFRSWIWQ